MTKKNITELYHLNCVKIVSPVNENVCGHCVLIKEGGRLILVDTGIGLLDNLHPAERIGQSLIDMVGYRFDENLTAIRQIEKLGFDPGQVTDCILSHLDNDHIGGIADFPNAIIHVGIEEFESYQSGNSRYLKTPLLHNPKVITYKKSDLNWFGFEARNINLGLETEIFLIPLFGHTLGHCGIAIKTEHSWLFYIADAYYLKIELTDNNHPVNGLAAMRAEDNNLRIASLDKIRQFVKDHPEIEIFGYHDIDEFNFYRS